MLVVGCALASALCYAVASVLQQRSAAVQPAERSLRLGLLTALIRHPAWIVGIGADAAGLALQVVALDRGSLVLVQPLLVCGLLFAVPIGAQLGGGGIHFSDLAAAGAVCIGLSVFLVVAAPSAGTALLTERAWALVLGVGVVAAAILVGIGWRRAGRSRAVLFSAGAGVLYGVAAGLIKTTSYLVIHGLVSALGHWQPYALVVVGAAGLLVAQSAFQAGTLDVSLPTMSVVDPIVSIVVGVVAFREVVVATPPALAAEAAALLVLTVGVYALGRSPAVSQVHRAPPP